MKKVYVVFLAMFTALVLGQPAFATECIGLIQQIDQKIEMVQTGSVDLERIADLKEQGQTLHEEGKHEDAIRVLKEALAMLAQ